MKFYELYPYQVQVARLLRSGKSVLLQAPTGAGKTLAALWPFLEAWDRDDPEAFPRQAIYSAPMRVLANQFQAETQRLIQYLRTPVLPRITIQTGEQPLDPEFQGDLIFATLDQTLSSLLGVPYSLSVSRTNVNVGAVLGSYLVFDEFHLFPYEATLTLLQLLRQIGQITPFVLMTATFSETLLQRMQNILNASGIPVETLIVSPEEAKTIATRGGLPPKERRFFVEAHPLMDPETGEHRAEQVLTRHNRRSLVVLNTVERAQAFYQSLLEAGARPVPLTSLISEEEYAQSLRDTLQTTGNSGQDASPWAHLIERVRTHLLAQGDGPWVMLLHSRFERKHRRFKEELLRALWGPRGLTSDQPSLIVVATQVVEVGLDISAEVLHTESAPAAAVLQRAGRCARYPGEQGRVYIYPVPLDARDHPNYAPYAQTSIERETCERSWQAFQKRHGQIIGFPEEQAIVNEAHTKQDEALLRDLDEKEGSIWGGIRDALVLGGMWARSELIRNTLTSRTVIIYNAPSEDEKPPFGREGFSLHIGTLRKALKVLNDLQKSMKDPPEWTLRRLEVRSGEGEVEDAYLWLDVETEKDLKGAFFLAVHPRLAAYDAERGFRLGIESDGQYESPKAVQVPKERPDYGSYQLECYHEHIAQMRRVLRTGPWEERFAWPAKRLAHVLGVPKEQLWQALYLAIALHDAGKLQKEWQAWAWDYQRRIGHPLSEDHCLVAHTYSEKENPIHSTAARQARPKKPNHAAEGAAAVWPFLVRVLDEGGEPWMARIVATAIARHHSPYTSQVKPFRMHSRAPQAVAWALQQWGTWGQQVSSQVILQDEAVAPRLEDYLIDNPDERLMDEVWWDWWLYFLVVRPLRISDGMSQERRIPT